MGFYLKKSIKVGLLRFNFSKSGIGVSTGIKGLRLGTGPRGNYIHAGSGGFYYRKTLRSPTPPTTPQHTPSSSTETLTEIDSDITLLFEESSNDELVKDIVEKSSKLPSWPWAIALGGLLGIWVHPAATLIGFVLAAMAYFWDETRKAVVIFYDFDPGQEAAFTELVTTFERLLSAQKVWHIEAMGNTSDWKKNAGANRLVTRKATSWSLNPPKFIKANIPVPSIRVGAQTICFLPDRLLVLGGGCAASVQYSDLSIEVVPQRFIETEGVPSDAQVVDQTWAYVNKSGGPDRRFKNNHQIPVCQYEAVKFQSESGLNELIQISKCGLFEPVRQITSRMNKKAS